MNSAKLNSAFQANLKSTNTKDMISELLTYLVHPATNLHILWSHLFFLLGTIALSIPLNHLMNFCTLPGITPYNGMHFE